MEYEVLKKTTDADKAFDVLTALPQPILIIIYGENGEIREHVYQSVSDEIKRKVSVMCQGDAPWAAKEMISKGRNSILRVRESLSHAPGDFHQVIADLGAAVNQKGGSMVGICIKNTLHTSDFSSRGTATSLRSDSLGCLIKVAP